MTSLQSNGTASARRLGRPLMQVLAAAREPVGRARTLRLLAQPKERTRHRARHLARDSRGEVLVCGGAYAFATMPATGQAGEPFLSLYLTGPDGSSIDTRDAVYVALSLEQARTLRGDLDRIVGRDEPTSAVRP